MSPSEAQLKDMLRRRYGIKARQDETAAQALERVLAQQYGIFPHLAEVDGKLDFFYSKEDVCG